MDEKYYILNTKTVIDYINSSIDFFDKNADYECTEIGDGNLNLVFRVKDKNTNKSLIAKQALPYVRAAGEDWPMDIERGEIESRILEIEYNLTDGMVPKIYKYDKEMYVMLMEDLHDYIIMRYGLLKNETYPNFAEHITEFLVKTLLLTSDVVMEHKEKKTSVSAFINPELCEITEQLVYTEPYGDWPRNNIEDNLKEFVKEKLWKDEALHLEVAKLKFDFMNNAQSLLHGDLHTGSIFVNQEDTKVIDPEFAFYGPMAYDIGALVANIIMAYISADARIEEINVKNRQKDYLLNTLEKTVDLFQEKFLKLFDTVVTDDLAKVKGFKEYYLKDIMINSAGVTGLEMIRRTVGFAHVKDLDGIENDDKRIKAKKSNILLAIELIKNRYETIDGKTYVDRLKKYEK
jgi:5-methylthioribose kinase